jgi:hypothetical protein
MNKSTRIFSTMELAKDQALSNPETAAEVNASAASATKEAKTESATEKPAAATTEAAVEPAAAAAAAIEPISAPSGPIETPAEEPASAATEVVAAAEPAAAPAETVAASPTPEPAAETIPAAPKAAGSDADAAKARPMLGQIVPHRAAARGPKTAPPIRPEPRPDAQPRSRAARYGMLAASVALAICIGAAAGAAGFATMAKLQPEPPKQPPMLVQKADTGAAEIKALKDQVAQLRVSVRTLNDSLAQMRSGTDSAGKATQGQIARLNESIERLEKAQVEPNARLARITETLDRLDRRPAATAAAAETTGSIRQPPPLPPLHRGDLQTGKPVVAGWSLLEVQNGVALVQSRVGAYEVVVGDDIRGLGRVQGIRRQDGRWVVVTARGLILPQR